MSEVVDNIGSSGAVTAQNHADRAQLARPVVSDPQGDFRRYSNRKTFLFPHELKGHPLFELSSLVELAGRVEKHKAAYWSNGSIEVTDRWDRSPRERQTLRDTVANIAHNDSMVILKYVVHDPIAGPLMQDILTTILRFAGREMSKDVVVGRANILITSPRRITNYHLDADSNYLLQVRGDKTFSVFDQTDRTLITDQELESFYAGDFNGAKYKADRQKDATVHDLRAGYGVHVPYLAPHWVQNGDDVSIAVSCNFDLASMQPLGLLYRTNRQLRKLGMTPASPRDWRRIDRLKLAGAKALVGTTKLLGRAKTDPTDFTDAGWKPPLL